MRKTLIGLALGCALMGTLWAAGAGKPSVYTDRTYGFEIQAPAFAKTKTTGVVAVQMFGPPMNGFSPNVNVTIQPVALEAEAYIESTKAQFKQLGWTLHSVKEKTVGGKPALVFDYEGNMANRDLRFLAMAVLDKEKTRTLLVTGACPKEHFEANRALFEASLNSFRLLPEADRPAG